MLLGIPGDNKHDNYQEANPSRLARGGAAAGRPDGKAGGALN